MYLASHPAISSGEFLSFTNDVPAGKRYKLLFEFCIAIITKAINRNQNNFVTLISTAPDYSSSIHIL